LPGYRSDIRLESGVHLLLWGSVHEFFPRAIYESAVILHAPPRGVELDFTLQTGRVVVSNHKNEGEAMIRARFHDQVWDIALLDGDSEVSLELLGFPDPGFSQEAERKSETMALLVIHELKGQSRLMAWPETFLLTQPPGYAQYVWDNSGRGSREPKKIGELPPWTNKLPPSTKGAQAMIRALDKLSDRLSARSPVEVILAETLKDVEVLKNRDQSLCHLSALCFGAIDDLDSLLDALGNEQNPDLRDAARIALRHWLGRGPDRDRRLLQVLEKKYKAGPAQIILSLLHGPSQEQETQAGTYETLIEYLRNDKLPIRELAFAQLSLLPGTADIARKVPYDPAGGPDQQAQAYEQWKRLVPDGQIPLPSRTGPGPGGPPPR
jgi:hypothetical protein